MRLFLAIALDEEIKKTIAGTLHELKKAGVKGTYMPMNNLHMTLAFIGERDSAEDVKEAMKTLSLKPFRLSSGGMETFGNILVLSVKGGQGLAAAAKGVRKALDRAEIPYDPKPFKPHITMIRRMAGSWQGVRAPRADMMVKKISLMQTVFKDGKPFYKEIFSIPL